MPDEFPATGALTRRTVLRTAAVTGVAAGVAAGTGLLASPAAAATKLPYPDVTDTSHASDEVARILRGFFSAKSRHDPDDLMTYFDKQDAFYIDASSGNIWPTWDSLDQVFHAFLPPAAPAALSYPCASSVTSAARWCPSRTLRSCSAGSCGSWGR